MIVMITIYKKNVFLILILISSKKIKLIDTDRNNFTQTVKRHLYTSNIKINRKFMTWFDYFIILARCSNNISNTCM